MDSPHTDINQALKMQFQDGSEGAVSQTSTTVTPTNADIAPGAQIVTAAPLTPSSEPAPVAKPEQDPRLLRVIQQAQQVRAEREAFKKEQQMAEQDRQDLEAYRALKARAKEDPVGVAEHFGYKPDEYAASLIDKGAMTPERRKIFEQDKEINELKAWRQETQKQREQEQQYAMYNQVIGEMKKFAEAGGDNYDLVRRTGNYNLVIQKYQDHYKQTEAMGAPEELPWEQAFEQAEQELFDKVYAPVLESPKIRSKFGVSPTPPPVAPPAAPAARPVPSGTINPRLRATSALPQTLSENDGFEQAGRLIFKQFMGGR